MFGPQDLLKQDQCSICVRPGGVSLYVSAKPCQQRVEGVHECVAKAALCVVATAAERPQVILREGVLHVACGQAVLQVIGVNRITQWHARLRPGGALPLHRPAQLTRACSCDTV